MKDKKVFEKSKKIKGYGSFSKSLTNEKIEREIKLKSNLIVKPKIIRNLAEYFSFIQELETSYQNPIFYRGQTNANYLLIPSSLRLNPKNEHIMIEMFSRKFSDEIDQCNTNMAKLVLMQHYGLSCRCLDISENPLAALYFACQPMKKFNKNNNEEYWGEVILFREPESNESKKPENLKSIDSSNVSIMASTAFMDNKFSLWHLGIQWQKDVNLGHNEKFINLKSIVRGSLIVRVPQNNPRIKNQQGAFIICNANEVRIKDKKKSKELTKKIIESDNTTFDDLLQDSYWKNIFSSLATWQLIFKKIKPYDSKNKIKIFKTDPFDIERLLYKDKSNIHPVILIPPECKQNIIKELSKFNITEDFIYPDMDNVANEINENMNK